jgi:putative FmdB family regulatory protein
MPTYAYRCTACGTEFDIYQRFDEDALTECPTCGAALRKLFSPTGIVFTDSRAAKGSSGATGKESSGAASKRPSSGGKASPAAKAS